MCQFLLQSKMNQLYIYIQSLFQGFASHLVHHRALSGVPCAIQQFLIGYLFYTLWPIYVNLNLPVHLAFSFLLCIHMFVICICVSISALQIRSSSQQIGLPRWLSGKESAKAGDTGSIPGLGRSLDEGMAIHSSILMQRIPWTEEPGRVQSMEFQKSQT